MNLVFFALIDSFVSFFRDDVFSNIDTSSFSGSNVRDILGKYFEENPVPESNSEQFGSNFLLEGVTNLQTVIANLTFGDSLIASAPILLLAASVVIILGVLGEAFSKGLEFQIFCF